MQGPEGPQGRGGIVGFDEASTGPSPWVHVHDLVAVGQIGDLPARLQLRDDHTVWEGGRFFYWGGGGLTPSTPQALTLVV